MAALTVKKLPEGDEWLYELKWDGYRALLIKDGEHVQIRSRNDKDLTAMYPGIATAGRRQKIKQIVLDGEIVALGEDGRPSFQALQHRSSDLAVVVGVAAYWPRRPRRYRNCVRSARSCRALSIFSPAVAEELI
jgi:ATP-dependent DNA ligase